MKKSKGFLLYIGAFLTVMAALYGLLVLSAMIPNDAIRENMRATSRYFLHTQRYVVSENGCLSGITDNYADQILVNISWQMGNGDPATAVLDTGYYDGGGFGWAAGLSLAVNRSMEANVGYTRYWHGTAAGIRLLHLWTDIQGIKTVGMVLLLLLIGLTALLLVKNGHWEFALCLMISLAMVRIWNTTRSIEYLPSFLICFSLCPLFLLMEKRRSRLLLMLSVVCGAMTAFFDFLTTETATILLPLILVAAIRAKEDRLGDGWAGAKWMLQCIVCWLLAYGGAFLMKWAAATLVTGENHFSLAMGSVQQRMSGMPTEGLEENLPWFAAGILANLSVLFGSAQRLDVPRVFVGVSVTAAAAIGFWKMGTSRKKRLAVLCLGLPVLVRYGILGNHSYLHCFFTYRGLVSSALALLAALALGFRKTARGRKL